MTTTDPGTETSSGSAVKVPQVAPDGSATAVRAPLLGGLNIGWNTLLTTAPIYIALVIIWFYFDSQTAGKFLGARNLSEMAQEFSYEPVLALGVVFVLLLGEIDLSLGYLTLLAVTIVGTFSQNEHYSAGASIVAACLICLVLGLAQGFLVAYVRMPSFVVTLGGFLIFEGVALHILGGNTINVFDPFIGTLGTYYLPNALSLLIAAVAVAAFIADSMARRVRRARAGVPVAPLSRLIIGAVGLAVLAFGVVLLLNNYRGVPLAFALLLAFSFILWYFATKMRFGRHIYAVGGNTEAARRAGINTTAVRWSVFAISGLMAGIAGVMLVAYGQSASTTTAGPDLLLDVISIAVIGGVSLTGGKGSVWGVLLGGLIIASVDSGLNLMNTDPSLVYVIKGAILLAAIAIDVLGKRYSTVSARL